MTTFFGLLEPTVSTSPSHGIVVGEEHVLTTLGIRVNLIIYWVERDDKAEQQTFQTPVTLVSTEEHLVTQWTRQHPQDAGGDLLPCGLSSSPLTLL